MNVSGSYRVWITKVLVTLPCRFFSQVFVRLKGNPAYAGSDFQDMPVLAEGRGYTDRSPVWKRAARDHNKASKDTTLEGQHCKEKTLKDTKLQGHKIARTQHCKDKSLEGQNTAMTTLQ